VTLADLAAGTMLASLVVYTVLGGADFGGGVWDLLARGPRARAQRALVEEVITPVWEVNHIWLILVVVLAFSCFPPAYAALGTALHLPLTGMLVGVVLRGAAFVFRHYDDRRDQVQRRWGRVFAVASTVTPLFLGASLAAVSSGQIRLQDGQVTSSLWAGWTSPFALTTGALTLALCATIAATFLTSETREAELQGDFRRKALLAQGALVILAALGALLAEPAFAARLLESSWSPAVLGATALAMLALVVALVRRRFALARVLVVVQATGLVGGWGLAQYPMLIAPDLTIDQAAAPARTLQLILGCLAAGSVVLLPSLVWLFRVFARRDR
jgi:cytochrome d ubiquinol oxidase subunit II